MHHGISLSSNSPVASHKVFPSCDVRGITSHVSGQLYNLGDYTSGSLACSNRLLFLVLAFFRSFIAFTDNFIRKGPR